MNKNTRMKVIQEKNLYLSVDKQPLQGQTELDVNTAFNAEKKQVIWTCKCKGVVMGDDLALKKLIDSKTNKPVVLDIYNDADKDFVLETRNAYVTSVSYKGYVSSELVKYNIEFEAVYENL